MNTAIVQTVDCQQPCDGKITRIAMFVIFASLSLFATAFTVLAEDSIPPFTAEGIVSWEAFSPFQTNYTDKVEGNFLFSYSNDVWQIQLTYLKPTNINLQAAGNIAGTMIDLRRIPDGTRIIITYPTNAYSLGMNRKEIDPSAIATIDKFPNIGQQELFLPWLSLCPNPELPLISSNLMPFILDPLVLDNPKNEGRFKLSHIEPEKQFLSELVVTNNGLVFLSDGSTLKLSGLFTNGFVQFSYKVHDTTNINGISFPLYTELNQFAPSPNGTSPEDIYPSIISRLNIKQIDVGGSHLNLSPVPTNLVALDYRPPGLNNKISVNYNVINDQWYSLTNKFIRQLANHYRSWSINKIKWEDKHSTNRVIVLAVIVSLTLVPLIGFIWKTKTNNKK